MKNNKIPPFYYRNLRYQIKTQKPNTPNIQNETKVIYKNI